MTASDLVSGVYASLAALRGWLVTGNAAFKAERAGLWKQIQAQGSEMDRSRANGPTNTTRWIGNRRSRCSMNCGSAQDKAEAIAHTIDEQPAAKILATEAAPLAKTCCREARSMIAEEGEIPRPMRARAC